jgi:FkbM family methyltransferase
MGERRTRGALRRLWTDVVHRVWPHKSAPRWVVKQAPINGYHILVFANEDVGCSIYCYRSFEPDESEVIAGVTAADAVCIDVGANVGYYTLLMASLTPRGQVHSFEPVPRNFHLLSANVLLNGFENVVLNCCAVGNRDGEMSFTVSEDGAYSSFLDTGRRAQSRTIIVPARTLVSYCRQRGLRRIDFMKVDVEGAEQLVLEGASGCLEDVDLRPKLMMIELYEPMLRTYGTCIDIVVARLGSFGYAPFISRHGRVVPFEKQHHNRFYNVFFAEDRARLESR